VVDHQLTPVEVDGRPAQAEDLAFAHAEDEDQDEGGIEISI